MSQDSKTERDGGCSPTACSLGFISSGGYWQFLDCRIDHQSGATLTADGQHTISNNNNSESP